MSADFAYRHFDHVGMGQLDLNHFNSARGPVIPGVHDAQRNDPQALCSNGPINVQANVGRASYKGLLVRADKRFSRGFQLLGSWAYSSNTGTNARGTGHWQRLQSGRLAEQPRPARVRHHAHRESRGCRAVAVALPARVQLLVRQRTRPSAPSSAGSISTAMAPRTICYPERQ